MDLEICTRIDKKKNLQKISNCRDDWPVHHVHSFLALVLFGGGFCCARNGRPVLQGVPQTKSYGESLNKCMKKLISLIISKVAKEFRNVTDNLSPPCSVIGHIHDT